MSVRSMYGSLLNDSLSRETRDVLELGLAALAFGTPAASDAGSVYGSMRGGPSMYGSMYGGSVTDSRIIKPTPSPAVQRAAEETWCSEALLDPAHGRNAQSTRADTADECTATPPHVVRHILPPPTESDLKRSVKEDVAALVNEIMGTGYQQQKSPAIHSRSERAVAQSPNRLQLPSDVDVSPEEAAEREQIRREIQENMAAMRKQISEEKAAPSPAPPVVKSPVGRSPELHTVLSPREPARMSMVGQQPASGGSAASNDGDAFWKALLDDLKLVDDDAVLRDGKGHVQVEDLDEPYHSRGRRSGLGSGRYSADRSSMLDGSYPSSLISSRSPSPSALDLALDNPVSLAAKRETLLGASLNSEYGSMRGQSLRNSSSSIDGYDRDRRRPDLGSDWQRDLDAMGSHVLGKLDNPHHKWTGTQMMASTSHTETLLQKLQQDQTLKMQRSAPPPVSVRLHQDPETKIKKINVLRNLRVKCKVDNSGATVHATWEALRDVWGLPRDIGLVYEVQMIVRWISSQTWNTIYTVTEPTCTVKGLKPNCPFAVRVRAVMGNWSSDYTIPCEFVTQESQTPEHQPSAVAAHEQNAQTFQSSSLKQAEHKPESESKKIPEISSFYPPQMSYLERVMQARQEQADREAAKAAADKAAAERAAVEKVLAERAASERAVVEQAAREHREQEQQVEMQKEANIAQASRVHVQRAAAPADTRSEGMSDYANLALSMNTNLPSTASNERVTTGSDGKQRVVVRISLSDPKNPHYAKYQEQMAAQKLEKEKEAEQPVQRQIQHTESSELYGSIYQARRATPDVSITTTTVVSSTQATGTVVPSTKAPAELYGSNRDMYGSDRRVVHTTPLIYHSKPMTESTGPSYLDPLVRLGPLARAFGVSSYARGEVPQEVRRVIAKPVSHMTASSDVPMVRAHVVNAGEDLRPADPITLRRRGVA